jgi:TP901 family phage tail tape measure protein
MADTTNNPSELESLVTRFTADVSGYMTGTSQVIARTEEIAVAVNALGAKLGSAAQVMVQIGTAAGGALTEMAAGLVALTGVIDQVGTKLSGSSLSSLTTTLGGFTKQAEAINAKIPVFDTFRTTIDNVATSLDRFKGIGGSISSVNESLVELGQTIARYNKSTRLKTFDATAQGLANSINKMTITTGSIPLLKAELDGLIIWMTNAGQNFPKAATDLARSFGRLGGFLDSINNLSKTTVLKDLPVELGNFAAAIARIDNAKIVEMGKALRGIGNAVTAFNKINIQGLLPFTQNLAKAMAALNAIPVGNNVTQIANALNQLGTGVRNATRAAGGAGGGGAGGGGGKAGGGWFGWLNLIPPAAGQAGNSLRSVAYDSMLLQRNAESAGGALISLRYGLLGLGALGLFQFAQMDDAIVRLSARTGDFAFQFRDEMRAGLIEQTGKSINSITEQGKAMERLTVAGLSATAAVKALAVADDFATASGMKMGLATKGLTDLMHGMGEVGEDADDFRKKMAHLSDILVGVSIRSGATEQQMMEAFSGRFQTSARAMGMSIEESMALLGALARAGEHYRGQKGGNIAGRGLIQLKSEIGSRAQWLEMFGDVAHDAAGKARPIFDVLSMMQEKMSGVDTEKFIATLKLAGLGTSETTFAIEPLLRTLAHAKELRKEIDLMGGSTAKVADTIRKGFISQIYRLGNALGDASGVIGERLAPAMYLITKPLTDMANAFAKLNPAIQNLIVYAGLALVLWRPLTGLFMWAISPITMVASAMVNLAMKGLYLVWEGLKLVVSLIPMAIKGLMMLGGAALWAVGSFMTLSTKTVIFFSRMAHAIMSNFGQVLYYGLVGVVTAVGAVFTAAIMPVWLFASAVVGVIRLLSNLSLVVGAVGQVVGDFLSNVIRGGVAAATSVLGTFAAVLTQLVFGLIPALLTAIVVYPIMIAGLAAVGAVVGTLAISIGGLATAIGVGLVQAWEAVRSNSRAVLEWMHVKVFQITQNASVLWRTLVEGSEKFFASFWRGITAVSGLLWNFRHNFTAIIEWLEKHGVQPFEDLVQASMTALETLGSNLWLIFGAVGTTLREVFNGLYYTVTEIFGRIRRWMANEWENIGHDMNMVFKSIGNSILLNFGQIFSALFKLFDAYTYEYFIGKGWSTFHDKWVAKNKEEAFKELSGGFTSPLAGIGDFKTKVFSSDDKTDLKSLLWNVSGAEIQGIWADAGGKIAKGFSDAFENMNPILKAFMDLQDLPIWKELFASLKFTLPGFTEAGDFLKKTLGLGEMGNEGLGKAIGGGGGPGFTFKQGSMERFMYDGATNEKIQYQMLHLTQGIRKDVAIIAAQHGNSATPRPTTWRPPLVAPWHPPLVLE